MRNNVGIVAASAAVGMTTLALAAPAHSAEPRAVSTDQIAMKARSGGTAIAPPGTAYGKVSQSSQSLLGSSGLTITYTFYQAPNTQARFCPAARGYVKSSTAPSGYKAKWFKGPCGRSMKVKVPWGKAASYPAVRIRSAETITGAVAKWKL